MNEIFELLIVLVLVASATGFLVRRHLTSKATSSGCGGSRKACGCSKPTLPEHLRKTVAPKR